MVSIKAKLGSVLLAGAMGAASPTWTVPAALAAPVATDTVAAAIADPARPTDDRALDEARHPADILKVLKLKPGETIADIWPGDYWDRLFSNVVGPRGRVYAVHLPVADKAEKVATPADGATPVAGHPNVIAVSTAPTDMILPAKADVIWIRQNYHDLYDPFMGPVDVPAFNKAVYRALKPGGRFVIIDHIAPEGSKLAATNTTHRIDPAVVKADMAAAGFVFVGQSDVLRNPADPHTIKVFDPSIRGHTDQFVYVFKRG
jgi:predicted methyltransferase